MKKTKQIEKELLSALERGQPLEPIRTKYTSAKGSFYIALERATTIIASKLVKAGAELRGLNANVAQGREKLESLGRDVRAREGRNVELDKAKLEKRHAIDELDVEYKNRMSALNTEFVAKKEKLRKATVKAEEVHRRRMSELDTEISAKEELLREFRKAGVEPEAALRIIREHVDLSTENDGLARAIGAKSEKVAELDRHISLAEENLKGLKDGIRTQQAQCKWELSAAGKALSAMSMETARIDQQRTFLNCEVNRLSAKRAELEPKVDELRREHGALVDVTELGLRAARMVQALRTLDDEVASLKRTRGELADVIRKLRKRKAKLEFITAQVVPNMVAVGGAYGSIHNMIHMTRFATSR